MQLDNPRLDIPYIGMDEQGETTRNWAKLKFDGVVNHRRLKREVRKWVKRALGRCVHTTELRSVIRRRIYYT